MSLTINTNTSSLNVQRNLRNANMDSSSSLAKLSSGSRVPTARDDAASLAIGSRLSAEVAGLNQASVNASQATSLLQIADGAYTQINDVLVRMSSLAIQSNSGQLSDAERTILNTEFTQLRSEIDRIATDTEFNGNSLIQGTDIVATQTEAKSGSLAAVGISMSFDVGETANNDVFQLQYNGTSEVMTVRNTASGEEVQVDITAALDAVAGTGADLGAGETLDVSFAAVGVTVTLDSGFVRANNFNTDMNAVDDSGAITVGAITNDNYESGLTISDADFTALTGAATSFTAETGQINLLLTETGGGAITMSDVDGIFEFALGTGAYGAATGDLVPGGGGSQTISVRFAGSDNVIGSFDIASIAVSGGATTGNIRLDIGEGLSRIAESAGGATTSFSFQVGTGTTSNVDDIAVSLNAASTQALGINASTIDTQTNAAASITNVKAAIDTLQTARAQTGASLSRLDFASSNLAVTIENQEAAKSGLMDVDVAAEITKFTSSQVVVQAGVSLLAQANSRPELLLQLLR